MKSVMDLMLLDENALISTQQDCQQIIDNTLAHLAVLVAESRLSPAEKDELFRGIAHIRGHIYAESAALYADRQDRTN